MTGPRAAQAVVFFEVEPEVQGRGRPMFQRATETLRRIILLTEAPSFEPVLGEFKPIHTINIVKLPMG